MIKRGKGESSSSKYFDDDDPKPQVALKSSLGEVLVDLTKKRGSLMSSEKYRDTFTLCPIRKKNTDVKYPVLQSMKGSIL